MMRQAQLVTKVRISSNDLWGLKKFGNSHNNDLNFDPPIDTRS